QFAAIHHYLYWLCLAVTGVSLTPRLRAGSDRWSAAAYLAVSTCVGVWLVAHPLLATIDNSPKSLAIALLSLAFPIGLAIVDHRDLPLTFAAPAARKRSLLWLCLLTGTAAWAVYSTAAAYRAGGVPDSLTTLVVGSATSWV